MKKLSNWLSLVLVLTLCAALLAGCGGTAQTENGVYTVRSAPGAAGADDNAAPLGEASGFTFDFENLTYSFSGPENAEFFYIKVYPVENGAESNSASFQSDKIDANSANAYSGTIEGETLLAGDYIAHVVASASGYKSSDSSVSGTSTLLAAASVSANWNTGSEEDPTVSADITVTAGDDITKSFTLTVTNEAGSVVYTNDNAAPGPINLTAADLGVETLTVEDVYTVTVVVNPVSGYKLPTPNEASTQITERRFGPGSGGPGGS